MSVVNIMNAVNLWSAANCTGCHSLSALQAQIDDAHRQDGSLIRR
jgi:hypothetical protein